MPASRIADTVGAPAGIAPRAAGESTVTSRASTPTPLTQEVIDFLEQYDKHDSSPPRTSNRQVEHGEALPVETTLSVREGRMNRQSLARPMIGSRCARCSG